MRFSHFPALKRVRFHISRSKEVLIQELLEDICSYFSVTCLNHVLPFGGTHFHDITDYQAVTRHGICGVRVIPGASEVWYT